MTLARQAHGIGATPHLQLVEDVVQVVLDGLLADKELSAKFVANGALRVEAEFSEGAVVAQWRALFETLGGV